MFLLLRSGLLLSFIAVFLQPLLPEQYQVAPVCETITRALLLPHKTMTAVGHDVHSSHLHADQQQVTTQNEHHHHDASHQCQYCTVYGNLVLPPELELKEVLDRIQVRLLAFQKRFQHVWFALQQLFLLPQGRAPPHFA